MQVSRGEQSAAAQLCDTIIVRERNVEAALSTEIPDKGSYTPKVALWGSDLCLLLFLSSYQI